jgi:hypothetical protein
MRGTTEWLTPTHERQKARERIHVVGAKDGVSRDSSVGIATDYGLDHRMIGVRLPAEAWNFSLHHRLWGPPRLSNGYQGLFL